MTGLGLSAFIAGAADLRLAVELDSGQRHIFEFSDQLTWQISDHMLSVSPGPGSDIALFAVDDVKRVAYGDFVGLGQAVAPAISIALEGHVLCVRGVAPGGVCTVADMAGRTVYEAVCGGDMHIGMAGWQPGVYVIMVDGNKTLKFVLR